VKIQRLHLKAYGPFTDVNLDLAASSGSVNVLYGPNEAGKSSALRALEGFCFGIDDRTSDNHVHSYDQMRIGATLGMADGAQSTFIRRKGKKNTLSDGTGAPITDEAFERYLCGVGRSGFEALFCLSYQRLSEGSKSILEENGELGRLLFDARSDRSLRTLQNSLANNAEGLFKGTARSSSVIDKALAEFEGYRKILRKGDIAEYKDILANLDELESRKKSLDDERSEYRIQSQRLHRYLSAIPLVHRLKTAQGQLDLLGVLPELPADFDFDFGEAKKNSLSAQSAINASTEQIELIQRRLSEIQLNDGVLKWRGEIERLYTQVNQITKHLEDTPTQEKLAAEAFAEAKSALGRVRRGERPDEADLDIDFRQNQIATLGRMQATQQQQFASAKDEIAATERRLATAKRILQETSAIQISVALTSAVKTAKALGNAETLVQGQFREARNLEKSCDQLAARLGSGIRSVREFVGSQTPSRMIIQDTEDEFRKNDELFRSKQQALTDAQAMVDSATAERKAFLLAGEVPTETNLLGARAVRDLQWQEIKTKLDAPAPQLAAESELTEFERSIIDADTISDRLRREASRVALLAALESQISHARETVNSISASIVSVQEQKQQIEARWRLRWRGSGVEAETPRQMIEWLDRFDQLGKDVLRLDELNADIETAKTAISAAHSALTSALGTADKGGTLSDLLTEAEERIRESQQMLGAVNQLTAQIRTDEASLELAREQFEEITQKIEQWTLAWTSETACLKLKKVPTPEEADFALKALAEATEKLKVSRYAEKRVTSMKSDVNEFAIDVSKVVSSIAVELKDLPPLAAIQNLYRTLKAAERLETTLANLQIQLADLQQGHDLAAKQSESARTKLSSLADQAGCSSIDRLDDVVRRHSEGQRCWVAIREATAEVNAIALGKPLWEFCAEIEPLDAIATQAALTDLDNDISRVNKELEQVNQEIGVVRTNLTALDNGRTQVETQLLAEGALARVRSSVRPYLIYAAAESLIRAQIEEFRRANQGPILKKAGEIFSVLTDGSFTELTAELDDKDQPVLVAVRTTGKAGIEERLKVEALSSATRIGLYLALRLACLYHHVEQREGLPFVADDILLDFDDARARRVMQELGRLAEKTQVILFTHHRHLVDIGKDVLGDRCVVQDLSR